MKKPFYAIKYSYDGGFNKPYEARVTLSLPGNDDGELDPQLRMKSAMILSENLTWNWGERSDGNRAKSTILRSENGWEDLVQQVNSVVSEFTRTLREVKDNYDRVTGIMPLDVKDDIKI
jgi:hypothetical protein